MGSYSMSTPMQSLNTGMVVKMTRMENKYVQIGSAILASGQMDIMIAATITPIDWSKSPIA